MKWTDEEEAVRLLRAIRDQHLVSRVLTYNPNTALGQTGPIEIEVCTVPGFYVERIVDFLRSIDA